MPDVQQTISDFYRVATERDFSRDFQFRVLSIEAGGASSTTFDEDDLVYCTAGSLPARSITNVAVPYMGLQFNLPGVFDDETSTGNYFTPRQSSSINLVQLDTQLEQVAGYKLVGASVREVGAIDYDISGGSGAQVTFGATMAYHYFRRT